MPTNIRVKSKTENTRAKPEPPLARLHSTTPTPTSSHRENRSASQPKIGEAIR